MALLEKQKQLKLTKSKIAAAKLKPISVTIANDLFNPKPMPDEHIVKLNGNDINPQKENQTEAVVAHQNVDASISVESSSATSMPVTTVVKGSGARENNLNVPEIDAERPEKASGIKEPINVISHDKQKLQDIETEYMSYR